MTDIEKELPERLAKAEDYMACGVFGSASAELLKAKNAQLTELRRQVASLKEALEKVKQGLGARLQANEPAPEPID